ncbi:COPII subunit [Saccharomycopsis crataegensis]|uniref:COPII subunit n=1 Tax=Saccharomycopsis crataegensis TaxID=43959 RepID=A0AAV5QFY2_9ASCO|nr:COPII subunit [Saccharomycopsis crataegensis]
MSHKRRAYPKTGYDYQQQAPAFQPQYGAAGVPPAASGVGYSGQPTNPAYGGAPAGPSVITPAGTPGYPGAAAGTPNAPGGVSYFQPAGGVQQPAYGANVDQATQAFQQMNIGGAAGSPYGGIPPAAGAPAQQQYSDNQPQPIGGFGFQGAPVGVGSNNQLYPTDLLRELPPPISDLSLPPPPIVLPQNASVTQNPESNASYEYFRSTMNSIPTTNSLLKKTKLPLAVVVRPYISLHDSEKPIPVVSDTLISRCRRCRSYINPFISFVESGRRWRCNFCNLLNDTPTGFDYNGATGQQLNRFERSELNYGVVDFVAPSEYMVRPPQPLVYVFVLEVTKQAVASGLLATAARTILESLDRIPNKDGRTRIAIMAVDSSLHFFNIPNSKEKTDTEGGEKEGEDEEEEEESEPEMLVVSDLEEPFLPIPEGLLVNLSQARSNVEKLLNNMNNMFIQNNEIKFALGPALKSAHKLVQSLGGKIVVVSSTLPNVGLGQLKVRDEESVTGKPKEASALLTSANAFYKSFAVECNKSQVTVDMFLASSSYQDVASLSNLPRYTAGQTHFYPAWSAAKEEDVTKFSKELSAHLSMDISLEAVLRVRGSNGLRMSAFYGNFFNRSSDLCSFPTFPRDQSYVIEMSIEEHITKPTVALQAAVLHTTSFGERRIRVLTLTIPTTVNINEVYASADQLAIASYYTHKAVEKVLSSSLQDARDLLNKYLLDILTVYKKELVSGNYGTASPLQLSTNLKMLPLLLHSLQKHIGLRTGRVPSDHRSAGLNLLSSAPIPKLIKSIYPTIYSLHDMPDEAGLPAVVEDGETATSGEIVMPAGINDTASSLQSYGLYLIDNSSELFLWVGGDAVPQLTEDVFGIPDIYQIAIGKTELPVVEGSEFNERIRNIIGKIREDFSSITWQNLYVVRGGSASEPVNQANARELVALRMWALSELVEDRSNNTASYREFLGSMREKIAN